MDATKFFESLSATDQDLLLLAAGEGLVRGAGTLRQQGYELEQVARMVEAVWLYNRSIEDCTCLPEGDACSSCKARNELKSRFGEEEIPFRS